MIARLSFGRFAAAAVAAVIMALGCARPAIAGPNVGQGDAVVLGRASAVVLSARETHVVLMPVTPQRRTRRKPQVKGGKPAPPRIQLVLRDVVMQGETPPFDVFLVLEGPNIFQATATQLQVGTLEQVAGGEKRAVVTFDANEAYSKLSRMRGFNIRHLRVVLARRPAAAKSGKEAAPAMPKAPEIGVIELVRS